METSKTWKGRGKRLTTLLGCAALSAGFLGSAAVGQEQQQVWTAPAMAERAVNPVPDDAASIAAGLKLYQAECLSCHGVTGQGDGPAAKDLERHPGNLTDTVRMWSQTDAALFWKITEGKAPMPTFRERFTDQERWQIVNYIRTLAARPPLGQTVPGLVKNYLTVGSKLAKHSTTRTRAAARGLAHAVNALDPGQDAALQASKAVLETQVKVLLKEHHLASAQKAYAAFSKALIDLLESKSVSPVPGSQVPTLELEVASSSQALDGQGALWLRKVGDSLNPFTPKGGELPVDVQRKIVVRFGKPVATALDERSPR